MVKRTFENDFFNSFRKNKISEHTAFSRFSSLDLRVFKEEGASVRVVKNQVFLDNLSLSHMAAINRAFSVAAGAGIDLTFDESMVLFEEDPDLEFRSKSPLWVLEQKGPKSVILKRVV